jgi:heme exporter protein B
MRRATAAVLRKELRLELRTPQSVPAMALFSITTFVVFHFALHRDTISGDLASGVLWVTIMLGAMLGIARLFAADREEGGFDGFLLAPVDRTALYVAKVAALLAFLVCVQIVALPAFFLLLGSPVCAPLQLIGLVALADVGIAIVGTLVGALAVQSRARDLLVPLIALPLLLPVLIAAARGSAVVLVSNNLSNNVPLRWPATLALYDLVFGLVAFAVFDYLLED